MAEKVHAGHRESGTDTDISATNGHGPKQGRSGGKVKRHCGRFWWIYVLIFIILFLVVFLPIAYVAVPKIAQDGVNDATFSVTQFSALDPAADSVYVTQEFVVYSDSKFHPHAEAFGGETGLQGEEPYGVLPVPATDGGSAVPGSFASRIQITNQTAFARYNRALMVNKQVTSFIRGKTKLHQGGFPAANVDYYKEVKIGGFNKLAGFELTGWHVSSNHAADGTNANGTVTIPNVSNITVEMGNVTFSNYVDDTYIGNNTIYNMVLKPGMNYFTIVGYVELLSVLGLAGPNGTYENKLLPVTIVGNSSIYNGVHLPYYEYALKGLNQSVEINVTRSINEYN